MRRMQKFWWFTWKLIRKCSGITLSKGGIECGARENVDDLNEKIIRKCKRSLSGGGGRESAAGKTFDDLDKNLLESVEATIQTVNSYVARQSLVDDSITTCVLIVYCLHTGKTHPLQELHLFLLCRRSIEKGERSVPQMIFFMIYMKTHYTIKR